MCDPVTAVVGQAVLNIMEKEQCQLNALTMGRLLVDRLTQLQRIHPNIGERKYNFKILIRINYLKMLFRIIYFTILVRKNTSKYW
jgi:4-aminobutyrate aminotransferase and related aminotransferases